ncbi:MAG: transketolase, partial [Opitutaceae bacterium]
MLSSIDIDHLEAIARAVRSECLRMTTRAGSGHPTSSLSAADLMTALFFGGVFRFDPRVPAHPNNDRLIFSKGHASPLFYALWHAAGAVSDEELKHYRELGSPLEGHPVPTFPFAEAATGSLGQGLSIGLGMALNGRQLARLPYRVYVLLGDSEMSEGSQWEAIQLAAHYRLGNLIGIIDVNGLGQSGPTMVGFDVETYAARIESFGWNTITIDGHDMDQILHAFAEAAANEDQPTMIVARTIKGKGVAFLEGKEGWHGKALDEKELKRALDGLGPVDESLRGTIETPEDVRPPNDKATEAELPFYKLGDKLPTRKAYGDALKSIGGAFPSVVALDAEVSNSTKAETFEEAFPNRFFEMYIAEQNMVGVALGLA